MLLLAVAIPACAVSDPKPAGITCADGEVLDGAACVPAACGTGTWGDLETDDATLFVDATSTGGDGTATAPLSTIQAAVDLAGARGGATIALAAGTYVENVALADGDRDITILGRCPELVTLDGSADEDLPALQLIGESKRPQATVDGLTITGGYWGVLAEYAQLDLHDVTVAGAGAVGVLAGLDGTEVTLDGVTISGTVPLPNGSFGRGLEVDLGASVTVSDSRLSGNAEIGVMVAGDRSTLTMTDTTVEGTLPNRSGSGYGASVQEGATFSAERCVFDRNTQIGVSVTGTGASASLSGSSVTATAPDDAGTGQGANASEGAALSMTGCSLEGNSELGVAASGSGTTVILDTTGVLDTLGHPDGTMGYGVGAEGGAALALTGCSLSGNHQIGVAALGAGTAVTLSDTDIEDTLPGVSEASPAGSGPGHGIEVDDGASLTATGCTIARSTEVGVGAIGADTTVVLDGTTIEGTLATEDGASGDGVEASGGAQVQVRSCTLDDNGEAGIVGFNAGTRIEVEATTITNTRRGRSTAFGLGLSAVDEATLTAVDVEVSGSEGPGLYVANGTLSCEGCTLSGNAFAGALATFGSLTFTNGTITDTVADDEYGGGFGVYASNVIGAPTLVFTDSSVGPHPYAGIWLDGDGTYDIERNQISGGAGVPSGTTTLHGNAVFAEHGVRAGDGSTGLALVDNTFHDATIAVLLDESSAALSGNAWSTNALDLLQQRCAGTTAIDPATVQSAPQVSLCPTANVLTAYDLTFGTLYLPEVESGG